jgi:hypothetical protein
VLVTDGGVLVDELDAEDSIEDAPVISSIVADPPSLFDPPV